jgi:hypothetical protein
MVRHSRVWKAARPLLLCAASAGLTLAYVRMSDFNREQHKLEQLVAEAIQ